MFVFVLLFDIAFVFILDFCCFVLTWLVLRLMDLIYCWVLLMLLFNDWGFIAWLIWFVLWVGYLVVYFCFGLDCVGFDCWFCCGLGVRLGGVCLICLFACLGLIFACNLFYFGVFWCVVCLCLCLLTCFVCVCLCRFLMLMFILLECWLLCFVFVCGCFLDLLF